MKQLHAIVAVCISSISFTLSAAVDLVVDSERLNQTMTAMTSFGGTAYGASTRVAYSDANKEALIYLDGLMKKAGLTTHIDAAGNLVGRRPGVANNLAPILLGSHVDTVPNGGHFDGIVGVMSAIEVATILQEQDVSLKHPAEFVVWANEEGGKTGSRAVAGEVASKEFGLPSLGKRSLEVGTGFLGGNLENIADVKRSPGDIAAYLELHIEQGAILDRKALEIGVVEGIVGIRRWNVTVRGTVNHAGTTPMDQRSDALYAAAQFMILVREVITEVPGTQVATVGRIKAFPGAPNVVPGEAVMSLEIRDLSMDKVSTLFERIQAASQKLAGETGTSFLFEQFYESLAAPTDELLRKVIESSSDSLGLSHQRMPSGAGHDAQSLGTICPIGMIFVPSRDGVSHSPKEYTSPEQITNGANVLLRTLIKLDSELD
ncbi:Zn-dependent hydrolase [Congregibacter brevis]|uniref:Zn-dependent hydrolase n=1 Tax=Congregibacter brevis TaxID=3081201 RepID=A0ABZ0IBW1_9GAMM|nr:Zn-dependent hydrolase [Congregibacter sp. IMCC45268]